MKYLITLLILGNLIFSQSGENQSFKLKDGSMVVGTIQNETDTEIEVLTKFGLVKINKSSLIKTQYEVKLISGEILIGFKTDFGESIKLNTSMGELIIQRADIENMTEVSKVIPGENTSDNKSFQNSGLFSGFDFLDKDKDFALGEDQLSDLFFDPTGYTFKQSTLYLSGFSFGFAATDNLQLTTKWFNFFWGNLNLRAKYKIFEIGNWESQHALSIGAHYHTRYSLGWPNNNYQWHEGSINIISYKGEIEGNGSPNRWSYNSDGEQYENPDYNPDYYNWMQTDEPDTIKKYWGGFYEIGQTPSFDDPTYSTPDGYDPEDITTSGNDTTWYEHEPYENYTAIDHECYSSWCGDNYTDMLE